MFEDATFDSTGLKGSRSGRWWLVAFGLNVAVVAGVVVIPLIWPEGLPAGFTVREITVPAPGRSVAVERQASQAAAASPKAMVFREVMLAIPLTPPKSRDDVQGPPPADGPIGLGDPVMGVSSNGLPGGTGLDRMFERREPAVVSARRGPVKVSGGVTEGLLLSKVPPVYPVIAKTAGISGTVELAAKISKEGRIEELRVVSGNQMLNGAAIAAVQQWRYRPYLLNGEPVAVETTVRVVFSLGRN